MARYRAQAFSRIAEALVLTGAVERAADVANRAVEQAALSEDELSRTDGARRLLVSAFPTAAMAGRENVLRVLREGAALIATIDQGETLWTVGHELIAVEGWWGSGRSAV